ncbi:MAG: AIR synthase-related protein [Acetatifactor sp.]|nr:AIR synthase-related protein [Acetatifactor sp.]
MRPGKISDSVLKRSVLKQIRFRRQEVLSGAGLGEDCAIFAPSGLCASAVSQAPVEEGADMARLLTRCANNLASAGARPLAVLLTLLLPEEAEEALLRQLMAAAEETGSQMGMQIAGGHTTVSRHVDCPLACVTVYGTPMEGPETAACASLEGDSAQALECPNRSASRACEPLRVTRGLRPGQEIVLTKWVALEGTALLARINRQRLLERYPAHLVETAEGFDRYLSVIPEAASAVKSGILAMHDASEGGILAALWELAESSGVGLSIDLRKIPIRQETVEICEFCGVNPYMLASSGCLVLAADHGEALADRLAAERIPAAVIGRITAGRDRLLYNGDEKRYLDKPVQDEIYKYMR